MTFPSFAYIGCFTVSPGARKTGHGHGISVYRIDAQTGRWSLVQVCSGLPHPGFLVMNKEQTRLYAAHGDCPRVSAYAIDRESGRLTFLNSQPTEGHNGHHIALDPANRHVILDKGGGVAVFPINADGMLAPFCENVEPRHGSPRGDDIIRCTHQVVFDPSGRFLVVPERNLDKLLVYRYDGASGRLTPHDPPYVAARDWAGPRHIAFHPSRPVAYVVNETDSTVTAYNWSAERGRLEPFQVIASKPADFDAENMGSEIAISRSENFVFASNRGHDSIAVFGIADSRGSLTLERWVSTGGKTPRFFALDRSGAHLFAGNQDSDSIVAFDVDDRIGRLTSLGTVAETGTPTCIVFSYR